MVVVASVKGEIELSFELTVTIFVGLTAEIVKSKAERADHLGFLLATTVEGGRKLKTSPS